MRTILFNKSYGVLSQFTDEGTGRPTLKQFINLPEVYAAGRLDRDSEGLLLLTDDGALIKKLTDPIHPIEKTYWVMIEGDPTQDELTQLKGYQTLPAKARLLLNPTHSTGSGQALPPRSKPVTPHGDTAWIEIKLRAGKKRQIRHTLAPGASAGVTAAVGLFTLRLVRVAIGPVQLGDFGSGKWRELTRDEIISLKK